MPPPLPAALSFSPSITEAKAPFAGRAHPFADWTRGAGAGRRATNSAVRFLFGRVGILVRSMCDHPTQPKPRRQPCTLP